MKRALILVAAVLLGGFAAQAELDPAASRQLDDIRNGRDNVNQIRVLRVRESVVLPAGSIPKASLGLGGKSVTNVIISADAKTNTIVVNDGVIMTWTVGE